jgi:phosphate transport system protein
MRVEYRERLAGLEASLQEQGDLVVRALRGALGALEAQDAELCDEVIAFDDEIDLRYHRIERLVEETLALETPVATDLRVVLAVLHDAMHLERIGDQAVTIAKLYLATKDLPPSPVLVQQLDEMGTHVVGMIRTVLEAFRARDLELCLELPKLDDPVDRLNRATHLEALKLADDPRSLEWGLHMNLAARALERVGDNAVDIAEQVAFLVTGEYREFTDASHVDAAASDER